MKVAVENHYWRSFFEPLLETVCQTPGFADRASALARILPLVPDASARSDALRVWTEAATKRKVTPDILVESGLTEEEAKILFP